MRSIVVFISSLAIVAGHGSCSAQLESSNNQETSNEVSASIFVDTGTTISTRILPPVGFKETSISPESFGFYLRNLPLKPAGSPVLYFNGKEKTNRHVYCAVVDQEIDAVDLQQCADAVMRLRGEYLYAQKNYSDIHFNFLSDGKPRYFKEYAKGNYSYQNFRKYMKYIFSYANTGSLKKELHPVNSIHDIQIGDVFIQSGNPYGHAVIVVNICEDQEGKKKMLLAQSYMPAQETQIVWNPSNNKSPWFDVQEGTLLTPEWEFHSSDLRRF